MTAVGDEIAEAHRHARHAGRIDPTCLECEGFAAFAAEIDRLRAALDCGSDA